MSTTSSEQAAPAATQRRRDDGPRPGRPPRAAVPSCRIRGRSTRGPMLAEQGRQEGEHHRDADERDERAAEAHAAQERHRHDEQREEADGDGDAGGEHGVTRRLHRLDDRLPLVAPVRPLLAPARDEQQRVVDGDAQADQGDEELHDEAHVGEVRQPEHQQEGREDRDGGDHQRHEGEERREAKTSTASAPSAPNSVSTSTLGPSVSPPAASSVYRSRRTAGPPARRGRA